MSKNALPTVGAAMSSEWLPKYLEWLIDAQRDLELQDAIPPELPDDELLPLARKIRNMLDGYEGRLGIHGPFIDLTIMARDPKIRAVVIDRLQRGLEFAAEVGATHMVLHSPFKYFGSPFLPHSLGHGQESQINRAHDTIGGLIPVAKEANCTLVIETIFDLNPAPLLALIRSFKSDHVRLSIDTGHAFITHTQGGGPPPDLWVREAGALLEHVHLQDTDGQLDRHWVPGEGNINWHAFFEALSTLDHQPRLILELAERESFIEGAAWLSEQGLAQ